MNILWWVANIIKLPTAQRGFIKTLIAVIDADWELKPDSIIFLLSVTGAIINIFSGASHSVSIICRFGELFFTHLKAYSIARLLCFPLSLWCNYNINVAYDRSPSLIVRFILLARRI